MRTVYCDTENTFCVAAHADKKSWDAHTHSRTNTHSPKDCIIKQKHIVQVSCGGDAMVRKYVKRALNR